MFPWMFPWVFPWSVVGLRLASAEWPIGHLSSTPYLGTYWLLPTTTSVCHLLLIISHLQSPVISLPSLVPWSLDTRNLILNSLSVTGFETALYSTVSDLYYEPQIPNPKSHIPQPKSQFPNSQSQDPRSQVRGPKDHLSYPPPSYI